MPRMRLRGFDCHDSRATFFVTACTRDRENLFGDGGLARLVVNSLGWIRLNRGTLIFAYCVMPDHLHVLRKIDDDRFSLDDIMSLMKNHVNRESWKLGYRGSLWQARFYDHILSDWEDGQATVEYILQNPERKGIVARAEDYPYSGVPDPL